MVPDALSRDSAQKPLCQRSYSPMESSDESDEETKDITEVVNVISEARISAPGLSMEVIRISQEQEMSDIAVVTATDSRILLDGDGVLRIAVDGDLAAVIPEGLRPAVLKHVHGATLTGHYKVHRTHARIPGRFWWKG